MPDSQFRNQSRKQPSAKPLHQAQARPDDLKVDEQTGKVYIKVPEQTLDMIFAAISMVYSMIVLVFLLWLLFDVWSEEYRFITLLTYSAKKPIYSPVFRLVAFTFIYHCHIKGGE